MQVAEFNRQDTLGLHLVRTPASEIGYTCDIIVLHGLNGGPAKSFRHPEGGNIWFADFLPTDVVDVDSWTNSRIWTYGYDADSAFGSTSSSALDFARSLLYKVSRIREGCEQYKIIWVCHSLGGIVVKTALVEAQIIPQYQPILTQTAGVIFLGTPHTGSSVATVADLGARIAGVVLPDAIMPKNRSLIKSLRKDSSRLFETAGRFANVCGDMKIYNMYESLPLIGGAKVVERESAVMNLGRIETQVMLDKTNHRTMCRYKDRTDQNYLVLLDAIKKLTKSTSTLFDPIEVPTVRVQPSPSFDPSASTASFHSQRSNQSGLNGYNSDATRSTASFYSSSVYSASTASRNDRPLTPASTVTSPPPRPPAKEPMASQWPSYYSQDDRTSRYTGSSIYDSSSHTGYPNNPRTDGFTSPPAYESSQRNNAAKPEPQPRPRGSFSVSSNSSLYDAPYTSYKPPSASPTSPGAQSSTSSFTSPKPAYSSYKPPTNNSTSPTTTTQSARALPPQVPKQAEPKPSLPPPDSPHWICDGCKNPIYPFESRIHCLDCPDYDLCGGCHEQGKITKTHKRNHKEELIVKARQITQEQSELVIPSEVHPERSPGRQFVNWTIRDERRVHHLSCHDDHARYLISSLEPGNYRVSFQLELFLIPEFTEAHIKQLGTNPLGKLRVAVGCIKSKKTFFRDTFPENSSLMASLFDSGWYDDYTVGPTSGVTPVKLKCIFNVDGSHDRDDIGIVFQWSDFRRFERTDKALISFSLVTARFEDLLEFDDSFGGAADKAKVIDRYAAPPSQEPAGKANTTAAPTQAQADSGDSTLSLDDIFKAILEVAQEERDRQEQEAFQQAIAEELARRRRAHIEAQEREAAAQLLANYMVASQATMEFAMLNEYLRFLTNS